MNFLSLKQNKSAIILGILFFVIANPMTYDLVDSVVSVKDSNGPTQTGVLIHTIVFMILVKLIS